MSILSTMGWCMIRFGKIANSILQSFCTLYSLDLFCHQAGSTLAGSCLRLPYTFMCCFVFGTRSYSEQESEWRKWNCTCISEWQFCWLCRSSCANPREQQDNLRLPSFLMSANCNAQQVDLQIKLMHSQALKTRSFRSSATSSQLPKAVFRLCEPKTLFAFSAKKLTPWKPNLQLPPEDTKGERNKESEREREQYR